MKKKVLFLLPISLLAIASIFAQELPLISTDTASSWEYYYSGENNYRLLRHQYFVRDSVIDTTAYSVFNIDLYYFESNSNKVNAKPSNSKEYLIRVTNGDLFVRDENGYDSLMFSTNWKVGDTIYYNKEKYDNLYVVLQEIDTIELGSVNRKVWYFSGLGQPYGIEFIEEIGGNKGPILAPLNMGALSTGGLFCCIIGDEMLYTDCLVSGIEYSHHTLIQAKIYPNPVANDELYIEVHTPNKADIRYEIYSLHGKILQSGPIERNLTRLTLNGKTAETVILAIFKGNDLVRSEVIVKGD